MFCSLSFYKEQSDRCSYQSIKTSALSDKILASLSLRTFMWRWSGKWFQIVYIIYLLVFHSVLLSLKQFSCALFLCGSLRAFFALISTFYKVYCTKQIYADNLHNKCRGLSDWVGCKIAWFVQTQSRRNLIKPRFLCYADFS